MQSESSTYLLVDLMIRRIFRRLASGFVTFQTGFFWLPNTLLGKSPEVHVYIEMQSLPLYLCVSQGSSESSWKPLLYQDTNSHTTNTRVTENHWNIFYFSVKPKWNISSTQLSLSWIPHMLLDYIMPSNKIGIERERAIIIILGKIAYFCNFLFSIF